MPEYWDYWNGLFSMLSSVDSEKNESKKEKIIETFYNEFMVEYSKDYDFLLDRFLEISSDIAIKSAPKTVMAAFKESLFSFVNGQYIASVATIGIACEKFCDHLIYLIMFDVCGNEFECERRIEKFENISQSVKLEFIGAASIISTEIIGRLDNIRDIRNKFVHPKLSLNEHDCALKCIKSFIIVINMYSEWVSQRNQEILEQGSDQETEAAHQNEPKK